MISTAFRTDITNAYKPVTRDEERELVALAKAGCNRSRNKLLNSQLPFIIKLANTYHVKNTRVSVCDLVSAGSIGFMEALDKYDATEGTRLYTYMYFPVKDAIRDTSVDSHAIRVPRNLSKSRKATEQEKAELGVERIEAVIIPVMDINTPIGDADGNTYNDILPDTTCEDDEHNEDQSELVGNLLLGLNDTDQEMMNALYGFNGNEASTMQELGDRIGLTKQTVSIRHKKAIKRLNLLANRTA